MATKKRRRRARKTSSLKKTWRFTQKQRRRRKRMHPTRRRQETASIVLGLSALPLLFFIGIPAAVFAGVASGFIGFASKASPPPKTKQYRKPKNLVKGGEKFSGNFSGKEAIKLKKKASSCSDACKRSTHPKNTCDCICNGSQHGVEAGMYGGPGPATTKPRTRKTGTRRRTRKQVVP